MALKDQDDMGDDDSDDDNEKATGVPAGKILFF